MRDWFPNATTVAHFDPRSQTIHLHDIRSEDFIADLTANRISAIRSPMGTIFHELTHWADTVGTLWGRQYLQTLYRAYAVLPDVELPGAEYRFSTFIDLHDRTRRIMHSRYFRTVDKKARHQSIHEPWGIQLSCGQEFDAQGKVDDSRPILFARFTNTTSGRSVARQPITAGALLETTAVHSEIQTQLELIQSITDRVEWQMEMTIYQKELERSIYDPALTLYTAPVHILANKTKLEQPLEAYAWGARVAQVALNLQPKHFDAIVFPEGVSNWNSRFGGFRSACDPGTAFVMICEAGGLRRNGETITEWMARALRLLGHGSERSILVEAQMLLNSEDQSPAPGPLFDGHEYLKALGNRIAQVRRSKGPALTLSNMVQNNLTLPPMFDRDGKLFPISAGAFDVTQFDPEFVHEIEAKLHTWMMNFQGACR